MLDHIILFKANDLTGDAEREFLDRLADLGRVPGVEAIACGKNVTDRSRGFDYCLRITFKDRAGLDAYQVDPAHRRFVEYRQGVSSEHICVDFEW